MDGHLARTGFSELRSRLQSVVGQERKGRNGGHGTLQLWELWRYVMKCPLTCGLTSRVCQSRLTRAVPGAHLIATVVSTLRMLNPRPQNSAITRPAESRRP